MQTMINIFYMRLTQVYEHIKLDGLFSLFHEYFYFDRRAIVVEKDLVNYSLDVTKFSKNDIHLMDAEKIIKDINQYKFPVKNRYLKILHYLKKGYSGYVMVNGNTHIGDIWYFPKEVNQTADHPDCQWLGIHRFKNEVYTFDMYLVPDVRGYNLAIALQSNALLSLHEKGFTKAYGYFWADNVPALWAHRMSKWKEIRKIKMGRFLSYRRQNN